MENASKILITFLLVSLLFLLFFSGIAHQATNPGNQRNYLKTVAFPPERGRIYAADEATLAVDRRSWSLALDGRNIVAEKRPLLADLLAPYLEVEPETVLKVLAKNRRTVVAEHLDAKQRKNLIELSSKLDKERVFATRYVGGKPNRFGLEVYENPVRREYAYEGLLEPVLGFMNKQTGQPAMGIERYYQELLAGGEGGWTRALRDAGGNLIYNKFSDYKLQEDGNTLILNIDAGLQRRVERVLDAQKTALEADEAIAMVMESGTGKVRALASSNRYDPERITRETLAHTKMNAIQYLFEPGSVTKPFILALLLEQNLVNPYDLIRGYNGRYRLGKTIITDEHEYAWLSAEDVIVHSSNIGIAQLAQKLDAYSFREGMVNYGFTRPSGIDLPYEAAGDLPTVGQYKSEVYRGTSAYGYGYHANFVQLVKAFNLFNNGGEVVTPRLAARMVTPDHRAQEVEPESRRVLSGATAMKMLKILRKTATEGTGQKALVDGLFIAGKTGTAHIAAEGGYSAKYHSSFLGFANDEKSKYIIGVLVINPQAQYFASQTAAPTFRMVVEKMVDEGFLVPSDEGK